MVFQSFSHHRKCSGRRPVLSIAAANGRRRGHGRHDGWQPCYERTSVRESVSAAAAAVAANRRGCSRRRRRLCTPQSVRLHLLVAAFSRTAPRMRGGYHKRSRSAGSRLRVASCVVVHNALRRRVLCACARSESIRPQSTYRGSGSGVCPIIILYGPLLSVWGACTSRGEK